MRSRSPRRRTCAESSIAGRQATSSRSRLLTTAQGGPGDQLPRLDDEETVHNSSSAALPGSPMCVQISWRPFNHFVSTARQCTREAARFDRPRVSWTPNRPSREPSHDHGPPPSCSPLTKPQRCSAQPDARSTSWSIAARFLASLASARRVLFRSDDLLDWLDQKRAPSPEE